MFRTFLFVYCVCAYTVSQNHSNETILVSGKIYGNQSGSRFDFSDYVLTKVFLVPENSESLFDNSTLFLNCGVTKWIDVNSSSTKNEKISNVTILFRRIAEFSTRNVDSNNVTCSVPRNASSSLVSVSSAAPDNVTTLMHTNNMTCLIRSRQEISVALRSQNMTHFNDVAKLFVYSAERSKYLNVFTEGRYTCIVIYEDRVVDPSIGDDTTTLAYDRPFRIVIPDELADEFEKAITTDIHISLIFALILMCIFGGIALWIMYLLLFVLLRKLLRHFGYHCCCERHQRPKNQNN